MNTLAALQAAVRLLQSGRIDEAERALNDIARAEPDNADAIAFLGLAAAQRGDNPRAAELMKQSLSLNPNHPATLFNYGNVLRKLERWFDAADAYARVLAIRPDHHEARKMRALALTRLERNVEALAELDRVPPQADSLQSLTLRAKLRFNALRTNDALADYDRIVANDPENWEALNNRGIVLDRLERYDDALKSYDAALAIKANDDDVLHNRGATLICLQRYDEALPLFDRLIQSNPALADNWSCHGVALASLGRIEESIVSFERALSLDPISHRARNGKGMALAALGRTDEAVAEYRAALAANPDNPMTHGNVAFALLAAGDLREGFAEYEWRRRDGPIGKGQRTYPQSEWRGEPIPGRTLFLHPEQGFGDVVQFARFVPRLIGDGARVILEVPAGLEELCRTVHPEVVIVRPGDVLPPFDVHAPLMSLGNILGLTLETIPANVPYLHSDVTKRGLWRERLAPLKQPRVGVCWSGSRIHRNDQSRSIPFVDFARVLEATNVSFVSLQLDVRESDFALVSARNDLMPAMHYVAGFTDTAALIAELDLVVTVDTSVAHVAAALGKPVWILISSAPDWRWLLNREDSPWYPTVRLFRQKDFTSGWRPILDRVHDALMSFQKWRENPVSRT